MVFKKKRGEKNSFKHQTWKNTNCMDINEGEKSNFLMFPNKLLAKGE